MDAYELKQQIIDRAKAKGLTNQQLADVSGIPVSTIAAIRSPNSNRIPSLETAAKLMSALNDDAEEEEEASMPNAHGTLSPPEISQALIDLYNNTISEQRRWLKYLAIVLCVIMIAVIGILIYDITCPAVGWVQY